MLVECILVVKGSVSVLIPFADRYQRSKEAETRLRVDIK